MSTSQDLRIAKVSAPFGSRVPATPPRSADEAAPTRKRVRSPNDDRSETEQTPSESSEQEIIWQEIIWTATLSSSVRLFTQISLADPPTGVCCLPDPLPPAHIVVRLGPTDPPVFLVMPFVDIDVSLPGGLVAHVSFPKPGVWRTDVVVRDPDPAAHRPFEDTLRVALPYGEASAYMESRTAFMNR
jgi:hypothetical protein